MNDVYVVILAAGRGKRFWPFTTTKSILPFLGKPLILHNLERLAAAGFSKAIIVINPADVRVYMDLGVPGLNFHTVIQQEAVGMGDALLRVRDHVGDSPMLVVNAEDVIDSAYYEELATKVRVKRSFLVGKKVDRYFDFGYLKISGDRVSGIVEKPGAGNEPSDMVNLVFHYIHEPLKLFKILEYQTSERDDVYERALDVFLGQERVNYLSYKGPWYPMKYPWHVLDLSQYFLGEFAKDYRGKNVQVEQSAIIEGPVYIEDGVRIFDHAKIVGPSYIGEGTIIGDNTMIRQSHVGSDCVLGFNCDVTRSYVGDRCWFHSNYLGDSVLEGNISMGAGSVLANLRLDEGEIISGRTKLGAMIGKHVRIGVNTSVMPGIKIGADSFVGAGITIGSDIPEQSFVSGQTKLNITKNKKSVRNNSREHYKNDISS